MKRLFKQFSFPAASESRRTGDPGSIHEGGELGYALAHAFGAAFDNPDLVVACVIGDGEAETGPLAASWQSNKFLNPARDGAVLPILHLNGAKIAGPTVLARIPRAELTAYLTGSGWDPIYVDGDDPMPAHRAMARALDRAFDTIEGVQKAARRARTFRGRPRWPMLVLVTPKGWTVRAGRRQEGRGPFRAHQVPLADVHGHHRTALPQLERWIRATGARSCFDREGG